MNYLAIPVVTPKDLITMLEIGQDLYQQKETKEALEAAMNDPYEELMNGIHTISYNYYQQKGRVDMSREIGAALVDDHCDDLTDFFADLFKRLDKQVARIDVTVGGVVKTLCYKQQDGTWSSFEGLDR
jgi:hypothetical protein